MKRLFWGFIKIALIVLLLVWASRELFPDTTVSVENEIETEEQEMEELPAVEEVSLPVFQEEVIERATLSQKEPITEQQKKYVAYSLRAGLPDDFTMTFVSHGAEALSTQIARTVGEPIGDWSNLAVHKKTFWLLAELTLQNVNVDVASSFNGGVVEVQDGGILIHTDSIVVPSFSFSPVSLVPVSSLGMDTMEVDSPISTKKTMRRMSVRSWEEALQSGSR